MMVGGGWWCGGGGWWTAGGRHDFIIKKCFAKIKISLCRVYGINGQLAAVFLREVGVAEPLGGMFPQENEKVQLNYSSKLKKTLAITKTSKNHCYEWTINSSKKRNDGTERIGYYCAGCRFFCHEISFEFEKNKYYIQILLNCL